MERGQGGLIEGGFTSSGGGQALDIIALRKNVADLDGSPAAAVIAVTLLTAARAGEIRHLRWDDVDFGASVATIDGRAGTRRKFALSRQAVAILKGILHAGKSNSFVFGMGRIQCPVSCYGVAATWKISAPADIPLNLVRRYFSETMIEAGYSRDRLDRHLGLAPFHPSQRGGTIDTVDRELVQAWSDMIHPEA